MHEISTWSPHLNRVTALPTLVTTPTPSWPSTRPDAQLGKRPARMCRSVPQIVVFVTRTMASVDSTIMGVARLQGFPAWTEIDKCLHEICALDVGANVVDG